MVALTFLAMAFCHDGKGRIKPCRRASQEAHVVIQDGIKRLSLFEHFPHHLADIVLVPVWLEIRRHLLTLSEGYYLLADFQIFL
jgi:hypothetical protein